MDLLRCRFCRKSFRGYSALCPECIEELDKKYIAVRNYLDKNKAANVSQVAEETGIDQKSLLYLIRDGRLSFRGEGSEIVCMKCGAPIESGKYCERCRESLVHDLENTISSMESKIRPVGQKPADKTDSKSKMHILRDD